MKLAFTLATLSLVASASAAVTVTFDEIPLPVSGYNNNTGGFTSGGVSFNNEFVDYGGGFTGWNGFTPSNVNDPTTAGFGNQYAAITGTGVGGGGNYAVVFPESYFDLPAGKTVKSVRLTNTTYAALSMRDGDSFAKKFGGAGGLDPDYFKVTFTGYSAAGGNGASTGAVSFYLADFRGTGTASDYVVSNWSTLDLTPLGSARSVALSFASSDAGANGINTPTYVAIDDLTLVPEPTTLLALAGLAFVARRRR